MGNKSQKWTNRFAGFHGICEISSKELRVISFSSALDVRVATAKPDSIITLPWASEIIKRRGL